MAHLHPDKFSIDYIDPSNHGHAEQEIINQINQLDPEKTQNWHFYYSYSFKSTSLETVSQKKIVDCEIDFLCLLENLGVFVFEIKGGTIIKEVNEYGDTQYFSINKNGKHLIKNPFLQAKNNYYNLSNNVGLIETSIRNFYLKDIEGDYLVGFPDMKPCEISDPLKTNYNVFWKGDDLYSFFINAGRSIHNNVKVNLTKDNIKEVTNKLTKSHFTPKYDLGDYVDTVNVRVNMLTEEQRCVLQGLLENKRCLIKGQAGTGKTILSEMLFNHFVNKKERAIYFSYNELNAHKVETDLKYKEANKLALCFPFLKYVSNEYKNLSNEEPPLDENGFPNFDYMIEYLINNSSNPKFRKYSTLIIDEAQDIKKNYGIHEEINILLLLDAMIIGGLKNGNVYIFYDDAQNINFNHFPFYKDECFSDSSADGYRYTKLKLNKNCRNTELIAEKINSFKEQTLLSSLENDKISIFSNGNYKDMCISIVNKIKELINKGIAPSSITVLHTASRKETHPVNIILNLLRKAMPEISEYSIENSKKNITFTTNRKFKGLESDVVIYLRAEEKNQLKTCKIDYVTVSRAKALCFIFNFVSK